MPATTVVLGLLIILLLVAMVFLALRLPQRKNAPSDFGLLDQIPMALALIDSHGFFLHANNALYDFLDCEPNCLEGTRLQDILSPVSKKVVEDCLKWPPDQQVSSRELIINLSGGREIRTSVNITPASLKQRESGFLLHVAAQEKRQDERQENSRLPGVLATVLDHAEVGLWQWNLKQQQLLLEKGWQEITRIEGTNHARDFEFMRAYIHPEDWAMYERALNAHINGDSPEYICQFRIQHPGLPDIWVQDAGRIIETDKNGTPLTFCGVTKSLKSQIDSDDAITIASLFYENTREGLLVFDENQTLMFCNPAFAELTETELESAIGNPLLELSVFTALTPRRAEIEENIERHKRWVGYQWLVKEKGTAFYARIIINHICYPDGSTYCYLLFLSDFTEIKHSQEELWRQAHFDTLTGLPNRLSLVEEIEKKKSKATAELDHCWLVLVDLDNFREINEILGVEAGNLVLDAVAGRLREFEQRGCHLSRVGANSFALLTTAGETRIEPTALSRSILRLIDEPLIVEGESVHLSASIGLAQWPTQADSADDLINRAEQAMYHAKTSGATHYAFYEQHFHEKRRKRAEIISGLRRALTDHDFVVYLQPIIDLATNDVVKAEALIRWQHPEQGLIPPAEFIAIAEESGLIMEIGTWLETTVLDQLALWKSRGLPLIQVSINKSPRQLNSGSRDIHFWLEELRKRGLPGNSIAVEITENILLDASENVRSTLLQYRDAGIQVAMDDFGTGYSSLLNLKQFDIDYVKIDQSFIKSLSHDKSDLAVCEAITVMAHKMNIKVIAEGIESSRQADILRNMGVDFGQGYLYSTPLPLDAFAAAYLSPKQEAPTESSHLAP